MTVLPLRLPLCVAALLVSAGAPAASGDPAGGRCRGPLVYVATLAKGAEAGVYGARLDRRSGSLCALGRSAAVELATWVAFHPALPVLYATSEAARIGEAGVLAFRVDRRTGALTPIGAAASGGAGPTYLLVDARAATLFVAHWTSGHASTIRLAADGRPLHVVSVDAGEGRGPAPMQSGPRTHAVLLDPERRTALVTDLGADRIRLFRFDPKTGAIARATPPAIQLPAGSGPRHLVRDRRGRFVLVVNQLASTVTRYRWHPDRRTITPVQTVSTVDPAYRAANDAAAILLAPDGRTLYVTNRGEDSIACFGVGRDGRLALVERVPSGGKGPRALALDRSGRWLLVANQLSDQVRVFARDPRTGRLAPTATAIRVPQAAGFALR